NIVDPAGGGAITANLVFRDLVLDAYNSPGPLVVVEGEGVDGLVFDNVVFRNFRDVAVRLTGASAINIVDPAGGGAITANLEIEGCSFRGGSAGLFVQGAAKSIGVSNSVFAKLTHGVRFATPASNVLQSFSLRGVTVFSSQLGLALESPFPPDAKISVMDNLFARMQGPPVAQVATNADPKNLVFARNLVDAVSPPPPQNWKAVGSGFEIGPVNFASEDPSSADFLKPDKSGKVIDAADKNRGYLGAIPPN
ncbi:MAG TPA: hypothetical protein VNC50_13250, partial [Planctomycetia bacterium]|nr:hypothetical protein [Planctomycetia bacterium]